MYSSLESMHGEAGDDEVHIVIVLDEFVYRGVIHRVKKNKKRLINSPKD